MAVDQFQELAAAIRGYVSQADFGQDIDVQYRHRTQRLRESLLRGQDRLVRILTKTSIPYSTRNLILKPVGDACNLKCSYCPTRNFDVSKTPDLLALRTMLDNAFAAPDCGIDVTIHGGEPLLFGKKRMRELLVLICDLREAHCKAGCQHIQTNGVLLDRDWATLFKEFHVSVGVSLDGPRDIHNLHRLDNHGQGSYDRVLSGLKALRDLDIHADVIMVLPDEPHHWAKTLQFIESGDYKSLELEIKYTRQGCDNAQEYGRHIGELFARWLIRDLPTAFSPGLFESILDKITLDGGSLCWITGTCEKHLGVNQNGLVTPCCDRLTGNQQYALGSLKSQSLGEILQLKETVEFFARVKAMDQECRTCEYRSVCNGGCTFYRIGATGRPDGKDPMCAVYKQMFSSLANALRELVASSAPAL